MHQQEEPKAAKTGLFFFFCDDGFPTKGKRGTWDSRGSGYGSTESNEEDASDLVACPHAINFTHRASTVPVKLDKLCHAQFP